MTATPFAPSAIAAQQFQAVLTNNVASLANAFVGTATYNVTVLWNTYGQRWFVLISDQNGNVIVNKPLVSSPPGYPISMIAGYFTGSSMVFLEGTETFLVTP